MAPLADTRATPVPDIEGAPVWPLRRTRGRSRRVTAVALRRTRALRRRRPRGRAGPVPQAGTHMTAVPDPEGATARPLRRTRARRRCPTTKVLQRGPSGGQAGDGGAQPRGHTSGVPQADTRAKEVPVPEGASAVHQKDTRAMAARDLEGASTTRRAYTSATAAAYSYAGAAPQADTRATEAPDPRERQRVPSGGHARDGGTRNRGLLTRHARRRRPNPMARGRGLSGIHAYSRGRAGANPESDTRATEAPDSDGAPV